MVSITERIKNTDKIICRYLDQVDAASRGVISQDILSHLTDLVEHIMLRLYATDDYIDDTEENISHAIQHAQTDQNLKQLYRFHYFLQTITAHYALDEDNSERLMLKYYRYLIEIKNISRQYLGIRILHNLNKFPLNLDRSLQEYYGKIAEKVDRYYLHPTCANDRYYIQKIKPFFVDEQIYYEVTFTPANDWHNKTNRLIAFTKLQVMSNYACKFHLVSENIEILGTTMPISIIESWEISIRNCEFKNFMFLITGTYVNAHISEQRAICGFLTKTGYTLNEVINFPDNIYDQVTAGWKAASKTSVFTDVLSYCRRLIRGGASGQNVLRYLLFSMENVLIKDQRDTEKNSNLSNLFLKYGCLPFENMPYFNSLIGHPLKLGSVFSCIPAQNHKPEMLARKVKINTEVKGRLFTPVSEVEGSFQDIPKLVRDFRDALYYKHRDRSKMVIEDGQIYINGYKEDTCTIIRKLCELSQEGIPNYSDDVEFWLIFGGYPIDCDEKINILKQMFAESKVAIIYGSAGVGKSTMINHVAHYFEDKQKLFLAHTNPATDNLRRRVDADNSSFSTIAKFTKSYNMPTEYDLLVIDECSTVSNEEMVAVLNKATFKYLLLVGDTYQIDAIQFGNWFSAVQHFIKPSSVFELTKPYRTDNQDLLELWSNVRKMEDDTQGLINKRSLSLNVDKTLLTTINQNEAILCLNYDGLYGINNMNRFLQQNNPNPPVYWGIQCYKVNDPILFLESNRFSPLIYNNMKGRIVGINILDQGKLEERIGFDIELENKIDEDEAKWMDLQVLPSSTEENTVVRFEVNKIKSTDEDDDSNTSRTIVPFQLAYAVSIHKAQGLEYDSVKIVITDEIDELITHNIFYTAITRARKELRIYWTPEVEAKVITRIKPRDMTEDVELLKKYLPDLTTGQECSKQEDVNYV